MHKYTSITIICIIFITTFGFHVPSSILHPNKRSVKMLWEKDQLGLVLGGVFVFEGFLVRGLAGVGWVFFRGGGVVSLLPPITIICIIFITASTLLFLLFIQTNKNG